MELLDGLKFIEDKFKPLLYDQKSLCKSTSEFVAICEEELYACCDVKSVIFSYHSLLSWIPWTYSDIPQWEDLIYVNPLFKEKYNRIIELDKIITENNQATSFSYRMLQLHDTAYKNKRIVVSIELGENNSIEVIEGIMVRIKFVVNISCDTCPSLVDFLDGKSCSKDDILLEVKEYCSMFCSEVDNELAQNLIKAIVASSIYLEHNSIIYFILSDIVRNSKSTLGLGGMFTILRKNDTLDQDELIYRLEHLSDLMAIRFVQHYQMKLQQNEAVKSAKAAIMSRNMSHNLGSHVMAYLKQNLGSVIDIVKGNVIEKIVSNNHLNTQLALWEDYLNNEADIVVKDGRQNGGDENRYMNQIELPFLVGIGHFISYMQERQDYIATVSTDYVPYFSSLNFKDDIYDVLNPDLRFLRHTDRIGGRPDNILLSFIARSEGLQRPAYANILVHDGASIRLKNQMEFDSLKTSCIKRRENDIVIKFRNFDGLNDAEFTPVTIECGDQSADVYKRKYDSHNQANEKDLNDMRSFNLSLPGGIAGRQAVFSIIENIIRNAAKHGSWEKSQEKRLELTFDVYDCSEEDSHFMNSENSETLQLKEYLRKHEYFGAKDSRDLYILTITDNIPIESKKLEQLEEAIKQDYVYDDCSMVNENKGIKEIKISASWLRNLTHEEDEPGMAPILNVRLANKCLQYIICVPKVKKYAIICPDPELYIAEHLQSIYYYTKDSFIKERNKSFEVIAILDDETNGKVYEEIKNEIIPVSPNHIVKISSDDLKAIHAELKNQSSHKLLKTEIWQRIDDMYARMYGIGDKVMITIIDQKVADSAKVKGYNNETKRVECLAGENASGSLPPFVYKTHLETEKNFYDFLRTYVINKENADLSFAEGISGGNSTDRLVRGVECDFTTEWYYRHLNAMRKRIAIFDERLFSKTTNLTDSELGGVDNLIIEAIEKGAQETPDKCLNAEEVQELSKIGLDVEGCTYQSVYECVGDMVAENKFQYAKSHLIAVNHYKNISIYNIIFNSAAQEFDIYGYTEMEPSADTIRFKVGNVGKILRKGDDIDIIFKEPGFDYLSIHQGLLDKIYHQWGIVDSSKCKVTQAFYNKIMQKKETVLFDGYQYLLGLIIHSGRAKPSIADMPQKQPFIQYASLDHAMSDCKYTLVELLDNARYE
ncbi:hypothetical protein [Phocaeicola sp.]